MYETRHIPHLKGNPISASKVDKEGYIISFGNLSWKVTKGLLVVEKGSMVVTLYLPTTILNYSMNLVSIGENATMWYNRLGHMSVRGMKILHSRKLLPNLKEVDLGFCEYCVYGKKKE